MPLTWRWCRRRRWPRSRSPCTAPGPRSCSTFLSSRSARPGLRELVGRVLRGPDLIVGLAAQAAPPRRRSRWSSPGLSASRAGTTSQAPRSLGSSPIVSGPRRRSGAGRHGGPEAGRVLGAAVVARFVEVRQAQVVAVFVGSTPRRHSQAGSCSRRPTRRCGCCGTERCWRRTRRLTEVDTDARAVQRAGGRRRSGGSRSASVPWFGSPAASSPPEWTIWKWSMTPSGSSEAPSP